MKRKIATSTLQQFAPNFMAKNNSTTKQVQIETSNDAKSPFIFPLKNNNPSIKEEDFKEGNDEMEIPPEDQDEDKDQDQDTKDIKPETEPNALIYEAMTLSGTQMRVLQAIAEGKSVFFTGEAGTGKSYILHILNELFALSNQKFRIAFTAPTGVAACNIGGRTINSWAGIGLGEGDKKKIISKIYSSKEPQARWRSVDLLVIDEISMLSGDIFDLLSDIGKAIRGINIPFGGIQLLLCGDFFQLPPVGIDRKDVLAKKSFCFESKAWKEMFGDWELNSTRDERSIGEMVVLDKVFRQKDDIFLKILSEVRLCQLSQVSLNILSDKSQFDTRAPSDPVVKDNPAIKYTKLFPKNVDVDSLNTKALNRLKPVTLDTSASFVPVVSKSEEKEDSSQELFVRYIAEDFGERQALEQLLLGMKAPKQLDLKIGAQVMLLKNISVESGLVNGARGVVVRFERADTTNSLLQLITQPKGTVEILPVVMFSTRVGKKTSTITRVVGREIWETVENDRTIASRIQIPLMLAWAISIHKAQGMTIPYLDVTMNGIFEFGQAYVALSRATDLNGLILRNFSPSVIKANRIVINFYRAIGFDIDVHTRKQQSDNSGELVSTSYSRLLRIFANLLNLEAKNDGSLHIKNIGKNSELVKSLEGEKRYLEKLANSNYSSNFSNKSVSPNSNPNQPPISPHNSANSSSLTPFTTKQMRVADKTPVKSASHPQTNLKNEIVDLSSSPLSPQFSDSHFYNMATQLPFSDSSSTYRPTSAASSSTMRKAIPNHNNYEDLPFSSCFRNESSPTPLREDNVDIDREYMPFNSNTANNSNNPIYIANQVNATNSSASNSNKSIRSENSKQTPFQVKSPSFESASKVTAYSLRNDISVAEAKELGYDYMDSFDQIDYEYMRSTSTSPSIGSSGMRDSSGQTLSGSQDSDIEAKKRRAEANRKAALAKLKARKG